MPVYNSQLRARPIQPGDLHVHARIYLLIDADVCVVRRQRTLELARRRRSDHTSALAINAAKASSLAAVTQQRGPPIYSRTTYIFYLLSCHDSDLALSMSWVLGKYPASFGIFKLILVLIKNLQWSFSLNYYLKY